MLLSLLYVFTLLANDRDLLHCRSDLKFILYFWLLSYVHSHPKHPLLSSIDNSGNLEYRGSAVYPYLVPELQN